MKNIKYLKNEMNIAVSNNRSRVSFQVYARVYCIAIFRLHQGNALNVVKLIEYVECNKKQDSDYIILLIVIQAWW